MHMCDYTDSYTLSYKNSFPKLMHQNYRTVLFVSVAQNSTALDDGMFNKQKLNTMWAETVMANLRYNPGTHPEGLMIIFVWNKTWWAVYRERFWPGNPPLNSEWSNLWSTTCSWPMCILYYTRLYTWVQRWPFGSGVWFHIGWEPLDNVMFQLNSIF